MSEDPVKSLDQRLWIVTELYYPEDTSTGYYMTKIAEGLAGDRSVKVLCGQPNYSKRGVKAPRQEVHKGVEIFRAGGTRFDKNRIGLKLINMITFGFISSVKALRRFRKGDMVLVVTTPPVLPFVTAFACLAKGAGYTLLIHDNYPEMLVAVGKTKEDSFLSKLVHFANRWLYKYASRIIVVGRDMRGLLESKTKGLDIPITYIPNWAELETITPEKKKGNSLIEELGLEDKFIVLYAGNMGYPNDLETIVEAARELSGEPDIHFVFLGSGAKRRWLEEEVRRLELLNVSILDPKPREDQQIFLNACDVGVVSLVNKMKGVSMPSRTYNILAAGKPLLVMSEAGSEATLVVGDDDVGEVVEPGDLPALKEAVFALAADSERLKEMGKRARLAAETRYSLEKALKEYRKVL